MKTKNLTNIFIVEDNKLFAHALKADIESSFPNKQIKIHSFETGETCMDKFKEEKPEIVIIDYHLNSKYSDAANGIQVLDWIKKENPETNVIILTSDDHCDIALKSFKHGACDYVVKTETKFRKINYSLFNLFKVIEAKADTTRYKFLLAGLSLCIALLVGGIIAIQIFEPSLLK